MRPRNIFLSFRFKYHRCCGKTSQMHFYEFKIFVSSYIYAGLNSEYDDAKILNSQKMYAGGFSMAEDMLFNTLGTKIDYWKETKIDVKNARPTLDYQCVVEVTSSTSTALRLFPRAKIRESRRAEQNRRSKSRESRAYSWNIRRWFSFALATGPSGQIECVERKSASAPPVIIISRRDRGPLWALSECTRTCVREHRVRSPDRPPVTGAGSRCLTSSSCFFDPTLHKRAVYIYMLVREKIIIPSPSLPPSLARSPHRNDLTRVWNEKVALTAARRCPSSNKFPLFAPEQSPSCASDERIDVG